MKTEAHKLNSRVFWIFLPNVIKTDPYNSELYCIGIFWDSVQPKFRKLSQVTDNALNMGNSPRGY